MILLPKQRSFIPKYMESQSIFCLKNAFPKVMSHNTFLSNLSQAVTTATHTSSTFSKFPVLLVCE